MPLRGILVVAVAALVSLGVACAKPVDVAFDERADFSRYETWDWLTGSGRLVDAPTYDSDGLGHRLSEVVEAALRERGLAHAHEQPDLRLAVRLQVRSQMEVVQTTGATQFLSSFSNASPSYEVQSTQSELRSYEHGRLQLFLVDARSERLVWRGVLEERFRDDIALHLPSAVQRLLAAYPPGAGTGF